MPPSPDWQTISEQASELTALRAQLAAAVAEVQNLLASAWPNATEHPCMFAAWRRAEKFIATPDLAALVAERERRREAERLLEFMLSLRTILADDGITFLPGLSGIGVNVARRMFGEYCALRAAMEKGGRG